MGRLRKEDIMNGGSHSEGWISFAAILAALAGVANLLFQHSCGHQRERLPDNGISV
jgi:hypothetical protein